MPEAPSPAPVQSTADLWTAPHFSVDPKALYEAASAVAAPEGANVTEFVDDESFTFDESGRTVHVGHLIYKVLTQKGAEGWDSLSVGWEPWHDARPIIRARVIAPDFTVHTLDPNTITEAPARGGDYKTYSDGKLLRAPFPAIAPGVVVEEEYTETETAPLFVPGHVGRVVFGQEDVPVAHSRAVFDAPAALPLRTNLLLLPGVKPVRTEANGRVTLVFDIGPLEGIESREPFLPHNTVLYPMIEFSTGASWQQIAAEYAKIVDSRADSPAVKAIVEPLIAGKKTVAEKEAAILDYLDREVRYTGIEFGEAAIVPHDPAETLAKKYGDCKDKATLLVAMLRSAGIPAYVALLNAGFAHGCSRRSAGHGIVRPRHRLCSRQPGVVDRRHRPLRASGTVANRRPGTPGADCQRRDHRARRKRPSHHRKTTDWWRPASSRSPTMGPPTWSRSPSPRASSSRHYRCLLRRQARQATPAKDCAPTSSRSIFPTI